MAVFNPQTPNAQDPNYLFWSRPIQDPKPNTSMEKALVGAAAAVEEAGKGGINVAENLIAGDVRPKAEQKLDDFVTQMSAANATFGQTGAYDVLSGGKENKQPDDVKRLPSRVDTLMSARANGKVSPSGFDAQIYSLAKEYRNKYPSFRDFVDETISKATGVHPANQLVRGLIQDYNQNQQNLIQGAQHLDSLSMQYMDFPEVQLAYKYYRLDPTDPGRAESLRWSIAHAAGYKEHLKTSNLELENEDKTLTNIDKKSEFLANESANKRAISAISPLMLPLDNPKTFSQWQSDMEKGIEPQPSQDEIDRLNMWIGVHKQSTSAQLNKDLAQNYPNLSPEKRKQIVESTIDGVFNPYLEMINNGQYGQAGHYARYIKQSDEMNQYEFEHTDAGRKMARARAVANSFGKDAPAAQSFMNRISTQLGPDGEKFVYGQVGKVLSGEATVKSTLGTWIANGIGTKNPGMPGKPSPATDSQLFINFMNGFYSMLTGKNITAKEASIKALYDADNKDVLNFFEHNKADYSTGVMKEGAESYFDRFYGDRAFAEVNKHGNAKQVEDFRNNAEFQGMSLVNDDLKELEKRLTGLPAGSLLWDSDAHGFVVQSLVEPNRFKRSDLGRGGLPVRQPGEEPLENAGAKIARPIVENMNRVFRTLESSIYAGEDPDRRVVEFLMHSDSPMANQFIDIILHHHIQQKQQEQQNQNVTNQQ